MSLSSTSANTLVAGLGATGLSVARFLQRSDATASFFDSREAPPGLGDLEKIFPHADVMLGTHDLPNGIEQIVASPGIPDSHPLLQQAILSDVAVISDIELFVREAKAPFVGITGSNGKSTVTTLLYYMCLADERAALAGGNLGEPALDLLGHDTPDVYVLELSSFQLQRTKTLPAKVAVLLNITPDHLDWHRDEEEYRQAKYRVFREAEAAVVNRADELAERMAANCERIVSFGLCEPADGHFGLRVEAGVRYLAHGETLLLSDAELAMYGVHNQLNALAALAAGDLLGLSMTAMLRVLAEFPGLPHRMQFVDRIAAVDYINDSKATNVAAALAAIESVDNTLVLIAGGDGKSSDFSALAAALEGKLRAAVLIGRDAELIAAALDTMAPVHFADDMQNAVRLAADCAVHGDTVLLAPACASFDQYSNYMARGDAFHDAVEALRR